MSRHYMFRNPDGLYFVSFSVVGWIKVFTRKEYFWILLDSLNYCQNNKGMEIVAWCIMPNHVHLIFRATGSQEPQLVLGDFKRFTSKKLVKSIRTNPAEHRKSWLLKQFENAAAKSSNVWYYQFWQHNNKPIELWSNKVISRYVNYIHQNPVRAGIVVKPEDYMYSSARDYAGGNGALDDLVLADF